jgi:hypothetical protein
MGEWGEIGIWGEMGEGRNVEGHRGVGVEGLSWMAGIYLKNSDTVSNNSLCTIIISNIYNNSLLFNSLCINGTSDKDQEGFRAIQGDL